MKTFMDEDFLLQSEAARRLYHDWAEKMPIIDYHCHINPQEIAQDKRYDSISDIWLGGDHYKWRLMRANGVPESGITGARGVNPYGLFENFANVMPKAVGNPVYHWTHLELKRYFDVKEPLSGKNAKAVYDACNEKLAAPDMSARGIIQKSNVKLICTTDDPIDTLEWHKAIREDATCEVKVLPAFRPDKVLNLEKPEFGDYIARLSAVSGVEILRFDGLRRALANRIDYFESYGCRASDHALEGGLYANASEQELDDILARARRGEAVSAHEAAQYRTAVLLGLAAGYSKYGWVMQLHFGCMRDNNTAQYKTLGPDTGFDAMNGDGQPGAFSALLDRMNTDGILPRTVLYSLNPADTEVLVSMAGCFMANAECPGKIQVGSAWWFNDTKPGMEGQLSAFASGTLLGNFIGMLTDSRSFLSYTRHEYFRRILCNYIGGLVENGEYPADFETLGGLVQDICYNNTVRFFGFDI